MAQKSRKRRSSKAAGVQEFTIDPGNARRHTDRNKAAIKSSLEHFGAARSIVVDANNVVRAGNGTLEAARDLGINTRVIESDGSELIVIKRTDLTGSRAAAYGIADNRSAELAEWDAAALQSALEESEEVASAEMLGFDDSELQELLRSPESPREVVEDEIPEVPADPVTRPGDLWIMGSHRLMCGDSTDADTVQRLMGEERACLMNTDPPYGVSYDNSDRAKPNRKKPDIINDDLQNSRLQSFLESAFTQASEKALVPNAAWYLWHACLTEGFFTAAAAAAAAAANVVLHRQIIWVKKTLLLTRGQYHWKHEPCFMGWVKGKTPPDYGLGNGERTQTTVWEIDSVPQADRKEFNHATPKPVELFAIPIVKHTRTGELCYEPFAGTGPQFIAAEQLGRRCFGLEISPNYCDVIVRRWEKLTGGQAQRVAPEAQIPKVASRRSRRNKSAA